MTGIESASDLRAVIRELGAADPDPGVVAEKICAQLTNEEAHVVAQATLRNYVRLVLVKPPPLPAPVVSVAQGVLESVAPSADAPQSVVDSEPSQPESVRPSVDAPKEEPVRYFTASGQSTVSPKVAAANDWYAAKLRTTACVGPSKWIHFGKCTQENVKYIIDSRHDQAADVLAEARKLERLLAEMKRHKAATVADLPPDVGREVLGR